MLCRLAFALVAAAFVRAFGAASAVACVEPGVTPEACSTGDDAALLQVAVAPAGQHRGGQRNDRTCPHVVYKAKDVLPENAAREGLSPPMVVGTAENMDPQLQALGLDFTGLWWMRGNPVPEELVSFARATVNSSTFPAQLLWPGSRSGMWSWNDNAVGWGLVSYYALFDPTEPMEVNFDNATHGSIETGLTDLPLVWVDQWPFIKLNEDEWLRPTTFQEESLFPDTNYTLTRVVMADGQPHPVYWGKFMEYMTTDPWDGSPELGGHRMVSWNSEDPCMRKCQIVMSCYMCKNLCR